MKRTTRLATLALILIIASALSAWAVPGPYCTQTHGLQCNSLEDTQLTCWAFWNGVVTGLCYCMGDTWVCMTPQGAYCWHYPSDPQCP